MVEKPETPCRCTFNHATWGYFAILVMLKPTLNVLYRTIKVVSFISPRRAHPSLAATVTVSTPLAKLDFSLQKHKFSGVLSLHFALFQEIFPFF